MAIKQLTTEDCMNILTDYGTPSHVVGHCKAVAKTAEAVASALNEKGFNFDVILVRNAGLLHDVARVEERHWDKGAELLRKLGQPEIADIIEVHMFHSFPENIYDMTEIDMVCLGDRLVKEDKFVGIDSRMEYVLAKAKANKDAPANIEEIIGEKTKYSKDFVKKLEDLLGRKLENVVEERAI